jgi:metal-dependent HD superfamily phosphatase/phosphodiesterase
MLLNSENHGINREYYMALSVSHPVSTRDTNIIPRALARGMILVEDWYGMWYRKSHKPFNSENRDINDLWHEAMQYHI